MIENKNDWIITQEGKPETFPKSGIRVLINPFFTNKIFIAKFNKKENCWLIETYIDGHFHIKKIRRWRPLPSLPKD